MKFLVKIWSIWRPAFFMVLDENVVDELAYGLEKGLSLGFDIKVVMPWRSSQ